MYEAVFVVTSAALCGLIIGVLTIIMVTVQFYLFIELNWVIEFLVAFKKRSRRDEKQRWKSNFTRDLQSTSFPTTYTKNRDT